MERNSDVRRRDNNRERSFALDKRVIIFLRHYVHDRIRFVWSDVLERAIGIVSDEMLPARRDFFLGKFHRGMRFDT